MADEKKTPTDCKYVGTAVQRIIKKESWESIGIKGQDTVSWDRSNNWTVPLKDLNSDAKKHIEEREPKLVFV